jgi:hypothetical protein
MQPHELGRLAAFYLGDKNAAQCELPHNGGILDQKSHQASENAGLASHSQLFPARYMLE